MIISISEYLEQPRKRIVTMPIYKDEKRNSWFAVITYSDWKGEKHQTTKRGFKTKREAKIFETNFKLKQEKNLDMKFSDFSKIYFADLENRLKQNTLQTKEYIFMDKILPYFGEKSMSKISPADVIEWQNMLMAFKDEDGKPYRQTYLKTIHNQLSAIFNHAEKYYGLKENPARKAGNMGKKNVQEIEFWTKEEYIRFSKALMKKDGVYQAFEMLYWCGLRLGEMLALTPGDFDFEKDTVSITKSYQRIKGEDIITDPKTEKSIRVVTMPHFLSEEIQDYIHRL